MGRGCCFRCKGRRGLLLWWMGTLLSCAHILAEPVDTAQQFCSTLPSLLDSGRNLNLEMVLERELPDGGAVILGMPEISHRSRTGSSLEIRTMSPNTVIVRFDVVAEQAAGPVRRIVGFARARNLIHLLDAADLEANPRSAKAGPVTEGILESIADTPDTFVFKTKGLLVGASSYEKLQRNRYRLTFENTKIEGILDGGHNALALGTHILMHALGDNAVKRKIRTWGDFKDAWDLWREEINQLVNAKEDEDDFDESALDFLVPLEILVPSDLEDEDVTEAFNASLLSICSARNNNLQFNLETKAAKKGL